jgi:transposase
MAPFKQTTLLAHWKDPNYTTGRPSDYRPEYCDMVIEFMGQGYSLTAFAGHVRQSRETIYRWIKAHPEFSDAVTTARSCRVRALETKLLAAHRGAQAAAAIFALKNADPVEWKEVRNVLHDHTMKVETLTDAQLYEIAAQRAGSSSTVIEGEFRRSEESDTSK